MPSRRQLLGSLGAGVAGSLAGCSLVPAPRPKMDINIENAREETVDVDLSVFRPNVPERSEALAYEESFEVPPRSSSEDPQVRREDVLADRPYRMEVWVGLARESYHYHYRPDCSGNAPQEIGVTINLNIPDGVTFTQTMCSGDEIFL